MTKLAAIYATSSVYDVGSSKVAPTRSIHALCTVPLDSGPSGFCA